jgi:hypothetical protein
VTLKTKQFIIAGLGFVFLLSLVFVQWMEVTRKREEAGLAKPHISVPEKSKNCVDCHHQQTPGIVEHWMGSKHALRGVGCLECHQARKEDADSFDHYGAKIATIVTPRDCARCHADVAQQFARSHHAKGGNILASLDNFLAETVEGSRVPFDPHSTAPGMSVEKVNGLASAASGCVQCHGSKVAIEAKDDGKITVDDLKPDAEGIPTNQEAVARVLRNENGKPLLHPGTWPNTGIGRINLDGSLGSCSACHSRHDFSPRRARQPESCAKCHLGPDHPQKEIFEESKHGIAFRDLKDYMNLNADKWILGKDYSQAPTCATCHMSGHLRNEGKITHDPGERISWTNRPPVSLRMDTDVDHKIVTATDPVERAALIADPWQEKRNRMKLVCSHCHTPDYINAFYKQYDSLVILYNEKFAKSGKAIMDALQTQGLITPTQFDEEIEWTWFYLWHHEGRRARMGASMMAPDYTQWHGMYEVAERFYMQLVPQAREITQEAAQAGKSEQAARANQVIDEILARKEHEWFKEGAGDQMETIRKTMQEKYGQGGGEKHATETDLKPPQ